MTALTCTAVGGLTVSMMAIQPGLLNGVSDSFSCATGSGRTRLLTPGIYDVTIDLSASGSRSLLSAPLSFEGVEIMSERDTSLGLNTFSVEATGALSFSVVTTDTTSNCGAGDSGIVDMVFELSDPNGDCVPASYQVDANAPVADLCDGNFSIPCVERTSTIVVAPFRSGPTRLEVTGRRAGNLACYTNASEFIVPGNNLEHDLGPVQLPLDDQILGCAP